MSDQGFHEIQLTGKQLVFLFMAAVVLAVSIFLLGVSVGRGVRSAATSADVGAPGDTTAQASAPAATSVTPADIDYRQKLQSTPASGGGAAGAAGAAAGAAAVASSATKPVEPPQPPPEVPADGGKKPVLSAMAGAPAGTKTTAPPKSTPTPTPAKPAATPTPPAPKPTTPAAASATTTASKPPATDAGWIVQLNAFSTKGAADSFIKELKGKGYTAYSVSSATLFKVRIGPFATHAEADKMASRLTKDGYKPLVSR